jgi:hypothetical protein
MEDNIPAVLTIWESAPESAYHSVEEGGVRDMVLKLLVSVVGSQDPPCNGVQGASCCCGIGAGGTPP